MSNGDGSKTMLDEFAMAALPIVLKHYYTSSNMSKSDLANICYNFGEAMMEEREKRD